MYIRAQNSPDVIYKYVYLYTYICMSKKDDSICKFYFFSFGIALSVLYVNVRTYNQSGKTQSIIVTANLYRLSRISEKFNVK